MTHACLPRRTDTSPRALIGRPTRPSSSCATTGVPESGVHQTMNDEIPHT